MVTINLSLAVRSYSVGCARETLADRSLVWQRKTTVLLVSLGALRPVSSTRDSSGGTPFGSHALATGFVPPYESRRPQF